MSIILIVDFGSQAVQLIARRIREAGVHFVVIFPQNIMEMVARLQPLGIILSGGPDSVYEENARTIDAGIFEMGIPILGICYGEQLMCQLLGGKVEKALKREYGEAELKVRQENILIKTDGVVWMSHGDVITELPQNFEVIATSEHAPYAAIKHTVKQMYGVQFHPELTHSIMGKEIIENFIIKVCGCAADWNMKNYKDEQVKNISALVGEKKAICALSGGVDSMVAAKLVEEVLKEKLTCVFVDTGFLRKDEAEVVKKAFPNLIIVDAKQRFYTSLQGVQDPEEKRKIIGRLFIEVFEEEAKKIKEVEFLVQGTIYSDVIESAHEGGAHKIKSHHNVGGLPENMNLNLIEPLRELFKDEVRKLAIEELGLPAERINRHPFPGPGLAIRILGEFTEEKIKILQDADAVFIEELKNSNLYNDIWQAFCVLLPVKTVGVMGDGRTYEYVLVLRAVTSLDGMSADFFPFDMKFLASVSRRIINEVKGINRVVYDITSKPPATIEWE